ncbi:MAG: Ig-like domain-containing protein, partial [Evtepia sp.]
MITFFRRSLRFLILATFLFSIPASAFVFGTEEDLTALSPASNQPPIAQNMELATYQNIASTGRFLATDPEGDLITFRITKKPARGSVAISEGTQFIYTPYENKTGKDSFSYVAEDAGGNTSTPATVKFKIKKPDTKVTYADMNGHPAHSAAIRLAEKNILTGARLGTVYFFQPNVSVTREEFLAMAMDTMGVKTLRDATATGFADDDLIAAWAKPYIASALK